MRQVNSLVFLANVLMALVGMAGAFGMSPSPQTPLPRVEGLNVQWDGVDYVCYGAVAPPSPAPSPTPVFIPTSPPLATDGHAVPNQDAIWEIAPTQESWDYDLLRVSYWGGVRVRACPGTGCDILRLLSYGDVERYVRDVSRSANGCYWRELDSNRGWVAASCGGSVYLRGE